MSETGFTTTESLNISSSSTANGANGESTSVITEKNTSTRPANQLSSGLLGWYAICTSKNLKKEELHFFTMYNEPLVLYRDKESRVRCIKDLCPHRGASFRGGVIKDGEIVCPYHGGTFSAEGS